MLNPPIVFFCGRLLPASETFIPFQGEDLRQFTPHYVGTRFVKGVTLPQERTQVVNPVGLWGVPAEVIFKVLGVSPKLIRHLQQLNPVLVHAHFGVCGALALPLVKALKVPLIVTFHGLDATMTDRYARCHSISTHIYLLRREALKQRTHLFICASEFIKTKLLAQGFPSNKVLVHYIGVNTKIFRSDPTVIREQVVLFVGRLVEKKGCRYLIQAMTQVSNTCPDAKLVIIGDGPLRQKLEALAEKSLNCYRFLGIQPSAVVRDWMQRSRLLVAPSVTSKIGDSEGLPMAIIEAQSMGLPVVASLHGGIPEAVIHGETGFLVPERNWQSLAQHIQYLLHNPITWQRLSLNGQKRILDKFNLNRQTRNLEEIYHAVLAQQL